MPYKDPIKAKQFHKEWYEKNRELIKQKAKVFYRNNWEDIKARRRLYNIKSVDKRREYKIKKKFGIDNKLYIEMVEAQKGLCLICGLPELTRKYLSIDHNHVTGKVRGLLCNTCNRALGMFKDDIKVLSRAVKYLKKYENSFTRNYKSTKN